MSLRSGLWPPLCVTITLKAMASCAYRGKPTMQLSAGLMRCERLPEGGKVLLSRYSPAFALRSRPG